MFGSDLAIPVLDLIIIIVYLLGIMFVGIFSVRRMKLTSQGYFLAGRSLKWGMVGAALFASNISTIHLVGLAASGYNEGLVWGNFLLGLVFAPFYFKSRISTLPEFLERRYGPASRIFLAFMAIVGALFIHIGLSLYAGAAVFKQFFGINVVTSIVIISVITAIYTVLGGLKAVVVTEAIQTVLLVFGAVVITVLAILALPDIGVNSLADLKSAVRPEQLSMIRTDNASGLAWYAVLLGYPILGIWYWCSDQTIVQRVLGARSQKDAQLGPLFAGYVLFKDLIGSDPNQTLPVLINQLIPSGLKGLIAAGLLAALMSTIAAALNSSATLVAVDIVKRFKPHLSDTKLVQIGRFSAVAVMLLAMIWSTQGGRFSSIFEGINAIAANLAPPITTVFLWGVFWRRGTRQAAFITLVIGFTLGAVSFMIDLPVFGQEKIITDGWGIPFMMQAWWMFCICSVIFFVVSLLTPAPDPQKIAGLTWKNPLHVISKGKISGILDPRVIAGGLLLMMIVLYYILR